MKKITFPLTIGIIGYGRFGQVLSRLFKLDPDLFSIKIASQTQPFDGKRFVSLPEALESDIIFPAIPISALKGWLEDHQTVINRVTRPQLWVSVCSVMEQPQKWFQCLSPDKDLIISHPLFGPMSSKQGLWFEDLSWVMDPDRIEHRRIQGVFLSFLNTQGIRVHYLPSSRHDQLMARTQAIAFLFGKIGVDLKLDSTRFDTPGFSHVLANQEMVKGDTDQLLRDLFVYNRYAQETLEQILKSMKRLHNQIRADSP